MKTLHPDDIRWQAAEGSPFLTDGEVEPDPDRRLTIRWLGTAGYELRHRGTTLLIDPYLTRVALWPFLAQRVGPDTSLIARHVPEKVDGVLVGHSHFDHAMDVPPIALSTGAQVYGSESTANLCRASGVPPEQVTTFGVTGGEVEIGPFRVRAVPSEHSRFLFGRVPYPGDIPCTCELPLRGRHYRCGQVFSYLITVGGVRLYHAGSANLIDDAVQLPEIDVLMMCTAGRQATRGFIPRIIRQTNPRRLLPMHYDNFFRPLDAPMKVLPRTQLGRLLDDVSAVDPQLEVQTIGLNEQVTLRTLSG